MPRIVPLPQRSTTRAAIARLDLDKAWGLYDRQARFVANNSRFSLFLGGVGSGKSHALTAWAIRRALANPGSVGALLGRTSIDLATVLLPSLFARLEQCQDNCGVSLIRDYDKGNAKLRLVNNSTIYFRPYNRIAKIRGLTLTWAAADEIEWSEANPEEVWSVLTGRLRGHGPVPGLAFATSPNGLRGITRKFVEAQRSYRDAIAAGNVREAEEWASWFTMTVTSFHNPYNPEHFYKTLRAMSKRRYQQEVEGKVLKPQNTVQNLEAQHIIPWRWQDHPGLPRVYGIDWGTSGNHVALMFQVMPSGRWVCADELIVDDNTPRGQFLNRLYGWIDTHTAIDRKPPVLFATDRACPVENGALTAHFQNKVMVRWMESKEEQAVKVGIEMIRDMMDPLDGEPMLVFSSSLRQSAPTQGNTAGIIPAMRGYVYHLDVDGQPTTVPRKDNVNDHANDGCRYIVRASADDPALHGGRTLWTPGVSTTRPEARKPGNSGAQA